jgi:hypothetical protein
MDWMFKDCTRVYAIHRRHVLFRSTLRIAHPTKLNSGYWRYVNRRPKFDLPMRKFFGL